MLNNSNNNLKSFSSPFSPQIFDIKGVSDEKKRRRRDKKN